MKTVLIVDDEQDARKLIKEYLADFPDFELVGEAVDGIDGVKKISRLRPDIIFLDIQMPGYNGFELLTKLDYLPEIIFSTAYDEYAIEAFKVQALDYLLKPYGKKRFTQAIQRLEGSREKVQKLAEKLLQQKFSEERKIIVHSGNKRKIIHVNEIHYFEAYGDYTKVFTRDAEFLSTKGITSIIERLNPKEFFRIHRSHAVNLNKVKHLVKEGRYHFITLESDIRLKVSETFLSELKLLQL